MGRRDTDESIYIKIQGLTQVLEKRKATLDQMIQDKIKYQHMQGTKDVANKFTFFFYLPENALSETSTVLICRYRINTDE